MFRNVYNALKLKVTLPLALAGAAYYKYDSVRITHMLPPDFEDTNSGTEVFDLESRPTPYAEKYQHRHGTAGDSTTIPLSEFTDPPRGKFAGQDAEFKLHGIRQLGKDKTVLALRADPPPISRLVSMGILSRNPGGHTHILRHRESSEHSNAVSFTSDIAVAIAAGVVSSKLPVYGQTKTLGNHQYNLVTAELNGDSKDIAGPTKDGTWGSHEKELTVAEGVNASAIKSFRLCTASNPSVISCSSIFVRTGLPKEERDKAISLLALNKK